MASEHTSTTPTLIMTLLVILSAVVVGIGPVAADTSAETSLDEDGDRLWIGQEVTYSSSTSINSDVAELYRADSAGNPDTFVTEIAANTSADTIHFSTSELSAGDYVLRYNEGNNSVGFDLSNQSLSVPAADDAVVNEGPSAQTDTTFTVESNRAEFDMYVSAEGLSAAEVHALFDGTTPLDEDGNALTGDYSETDISGVMIETAPSELAFDAANADDLEPGEYTFEFDVVDADATATTDLTVRAAGDGNASFGSSTYTVAEGDIVDFDVTLENRDTATLIFGNESETGYEAEVSIDTSEIEGDTATVTFNSFVAGDSDNTAFRGDAVVGVQETAFDTTEGAQSPLDQHEYRMALELDEERTADIASMRVAEHTQPTASTYVAPSVDLSNEYETLNLHKSETVAFGDSVAIVVEDFGFDGMMDGPDLTAEELVDDGEFLSEYGMYVTVEEASPGVNQDAKEIDVRVADVTKDGEQNRMLLVLDMPREGESLGGAEITAGDTFAATLHIDAAANPYIDENTTDGYEASTTFTAVERAASFEHATDDGTLQLQRSLDGNLTVEGQSSAAPGTPYTITLRSDDTDDPTVLRDDVVIDADGTFTTSFDVGDRSKGWAFTLDLSADYAEGPTDAVIAAVEEPEPAYHSLAVNVEGPDGNALDNATVTVDGESNWGAIESGRTVTVKADHTDYASASKNVLVDSDTTATLTLSEVPEPDSQATPTYPLEVIVEDANGEPVSGANVTVNGSAEWDEFEAGTTVTVTADAEGYTSASKEVTIGEEPMDSTVTLEKEEQQTQEPVEEPEPTEPVNETEGEGPGFGVGLTVVALLAVALLARRSQ